MDRTVGEGGCRQRDNLLYHTAGHSGVVMGMDVLWFLVHVRIEIDGLRLAAVKAHLIAEPALVEKVQGRLDNDMDADAVGEGGWLPVVCFLVAAAGREAVGEGGIVDACRIRPEQHAAECAPHERQFGPMGLCGILLTKISGGLHGYISIGGMVGISPVLRLLQTIHLRHPVFGKVVIPFGVSDVFCVIIPFHLPSAIS